jgi:hypothetical protein
MVIIDLKSKGNTSHIIMCKVFSFGCSKIVPLVEITTIAPFDSSLRVETMSLAKSFEVAWLFGTLASTWKPLVRLLLA